MHTSRQRGKSYCGYFRNLHARRYGSCAAVTFMDAANLRVLGICIVAIPVPNAWSFAANHFTFPISIPLTIPRIL
jgi:hypothetical protein